MADSAQDIITRAFRKVNIYAAEETPAAADAEFARGELNDILNEWAARSTFAYNVGFALYTLVPNLNPHTIGPSGTFAVAQRPVRIENWALVLNNLSTPVDVPGNLRDDDWWANQRVKTLSTSVPTDLYYSPDEINGTLNFWPVPNFAYGVRLETWGLLSEFASLAAAYSLAPGYRSALTLTLAERLCEPFGKTPGPRLTADATRARVGIQGNNDQGRRIASADYGTSGRRKRSTFNYYTGGPS